MYDTLRDRICLLDYPPGTRLSEAELAAEFGTSRTPLRRVLARLEDEGLLTSRHGVGTIVTDLDMEEMARTYALREELADLVGRLDPVLPGATDLADFDTIVSRGEALRRAPDARAFARLNMDFFAFGLRFTANAPLREVSERLYYRTARIWLHRVPELDLSDEIAIFLSEMTETGRALRAGDTRAAALIRRAHISMCRQRLLTGDGGPCPPALRASPQDI